MPAPIGSGTGSLGKEEGVGLAQGSVSGYFQQKLVTRLLNGDFVGLGGVVHVNRNITGCVNYCKVKDASFGDGEFYVAIDTRMGGHDSRGPEGFVVKRGECDRRVPEPWVKEWKGDGSIIDLKNRGKS